MHTSKCDSGVVGNARPCQGRDRGFEPRLSLLFKGSFVKASFFYVRETRLEQVLASPLRCGRRKTEVPRTSCAVYRSYLLKEASWKLPFLCQDDGTRTSSRFFAPLRSAQSRGPPDLVRRLSLLFKRSFVEASFFMSGRRGSNKFSRLRSAAVRARPRSPGDFMRRPLSF